MNSHPNRFDSNISEQIVAEVLKKKPMHRKFLNKAISSLTEKEIEDAEEYFQYLLLNGNDIDTLAKAYILIIDDAFKESIRFRETGKYRFSKFEDARIAVYDNPSFMHTYMLGLALSTYWWKNHVKLRRFFLECLESYGSSGGIYREIGPGHGIYFRDALRSGLFDTYEGVDVSQSSLELTANLLESSEFYSTSKIQLIHQDFLNSDDMEPATFMVMGEVLEHVELPGEFLDSAFRSLKNDGTLYLTTCLNAPAIDHLYNPDSLSALHSLFSEHGFYIDKACELGIDDRDIKFCERERLTINMGYILKKNAN
jgi:SAM-dependent methyltransferase